MYVPDDLQLHTLMHDHTRQHRNKQRKKKEVGSQGVAYFLLHIHSNRYCVYVYIHTYVLCVYIHIYIHTYKYVCIYTIITHIYTYMCIYIYMYTYGHI